VAKVSSAVGPSASSPLLKVHAYDEMEPSVSIDPEPSKLHVSPVQLEVKAACGGAFGGTAAMKTAAPRQSIVELARLEVPVGAPFAKPILSSCPLVELTTYSVLPSRNMPRVLLQVMFPPLTVFSTPPMMPLSGENQRQYREFCPLRV
jgi:hypothetical protein